MYTLIKKYCLLSVFSLFLLTEIFTTSLTYAQSGNWIIYPEDSILCSQPGINDFAEDVDGNILTALMCGHAKFDGSN